MGCNWSGWPVEDVALSEIVMVEVPEGVTIGGGGVAMDAAPPALEAPWLVAGNDGAGGEKVTAGAGAMPVPLRTRVCGEPGALSATWRLAMSAPTAAGVKLMLTEQWALAARVATRMEPLPFARFTFLLESCLASPSCLFFLC